MVDMDPEAERLGQSQILIRSYSHQPSNLGTTRNESIFRDLG